MADITRYPLLRHLRSEPTSHVLRYTKGRLTDEGPGLAFWFRAIHTAVAEVPIDDRELPFVFRVRSADFQEVAVQGAVTFRVTQPKNLAQRIDFTLDLGTGRWSQAPLEQVAGLLTQLAQQLVNDELGRLALRAVLARGVAPVRKRLEDGLAAEPALVELGLQLVAVRVADVSPAAEMEKALRQPTREQIQQQADQATFERRALAVEKERAIAENELNNRIELTRREEQLVQQAAANELLNAQAEDERARLQAQRKADEIDLVEAATLRAERERAEIQSAVPVEVLRALAMRQLAGQLGKIEHLTVTPDLIAPLLNWRK
jgi:regulator of protease activity HflC (stomatin/prohibitin superfamily)